MKQRICFIFALSYRSSVSTALLKHYSWLVERLGQLYFGIAYFSLVQTTFTSSVTGFLQYVKNEGVLIIDFKYTIWNQSFWTHKWIWLTLFCHFYLQRTRTIVSMQWKLGDLLQSFSVRLRVCHPMAAHSFGSLSGLLGRRAVRAARLLFTTVWLTYAMGPR